MLSETEKAEAKITAQELIKSCTDKQTALVIATDQLKDAYSRYQFFLEVKFNIENTK